MDGRRRLLRSLRLTQAGSAPMAFAVPAFARRRLVRSCAGARPRHGAAAREAAKAQRLSSHSRAAQRTRRDLLSSSPALFLATGVYGAVKGGHYDALVAEKGEPTDILARALGFRIEAVTIAGQSELSEAEILSAAGIGPRNSLPFLDVASVRERLKKLPLIKEVERHQALSRPAADRGRGAPALRPVAEGWRTACRRRRRHAARRDARPALRQSSARRRRRRQ